MEYPASTRRRKRLATLLRGVGHVRRLTDSVSAVGTASTRSPSAQACPGGSAAGICCSDHVAAVLSGLWTSLGTSGERETESGDRGEGSPGVITLGALYQADGMARRLRLGRSPAIDHCSTSRRLVVTAVGANGNGVGPRDCRQYPGTSAGDSESRHQGQGVADRRQLGTDRTERTADENLHAGGSAADCHRLRSARFMGGVLACFAHRLPVDGFVFALLVRFSIRCPGAAAGGVYESQNQQAAGSANHSGGLGGVRSIAQAERVSVPESVFSRLRQPGKDRVGSAAESALQGCAAAGWDHGHQSALASRSGHLQRTFRNNRSWSRFICFGAFAAGSECPQLSPADRSSLAGRTGGARV